MNQKMNFNLENIYVIILCGGFGKRLRSIIPDQPKVLAKIKNKSFLDILIDQLLLYKVKRLVLCSGYLREQIRDHFDRIYTDIDVIFSEEDEPLGTGGAILNAIVNNKIKSKIFMVLNGDSICNINYQEFLVFHKINQSTLSIVLSKNPDNSKDYGTVLMDKYNRILNFNEKMEEKKLINAGIYLMEYTIVYPYILNLGLKKFSLEYDLLPKIIKDNKCFGFVTDKELLDIGNPHRYENASISLKNMGIKIS